MYKDELTEIWLLQIPWYCDWILAHSLRRGIDLAVYHKGHFPVILRKQGPLSFHEITKSFLEAIPYHASWPAQKHSLLIITLKGLLRKWFEPLIPRKLFDGACFISYVYFFSVALLIVLLFPPTSLAAHLLDKNSPRNDTFFLTLLCFQRFHSIDSGLD